MSRPRRPAPAPVPFVVAVPSVMAAGLLALVLAGCAGTPTDPAPVPPAPATAAPAAGIGSAESAEADASPAPDPGASTPVPPDPAVTDPAVTDPAVTDPPAGATALPASRVEAVRLAPGTPGVVWTRGGRVVGLYGRAGGCTDVSAELTGEDAAAVRITVLTVRSAEQACTLEVRYPPLEVPLPTDLGPRRVVLTGADG